MVLDGYSVEQREFFAKTKSGSEAVDVDRASAASGV
jgi:hypothetical protein